MTANRQKELNILVVDDESEIRELLVEYLTARGHNVQIAADGREALTQLEERLFDVLLTDLRMPVMEGVSLIEAVKEADHRVGIVVMTGFPTIESATTALKLGASDYLLKPFRLRDVYSALLTAAERSQINQHLDRLQGVLRFYEAIHEAFSPEQLPALMPKLLHAVLGEVSGDAGRLWLRQPNDAWALEQAAGEHPALEGILPAAVQGPQRADNVLALPITVRTHRYAVLAVAGNRLNSEENLKRLKKITHAFELTLHRVTAPQT